MKRSRKILSIVLAVLMLMSTMAMNFSTSAADGNAETVTVNVNESDTWDCTPETTFYCYNCNRRLGVMGASSLSIGDIALVSGDESVIDGEVGVRRNGYNEYYVYCDYTGLKAGTVTYAISFTAVYGDGGGKTCQCGYRNTILTNPVSDTVYLTINVGNPSSKTYKVVYKDGCDGRIFGDETHGNLAAGAATPPCDSSTNRTGYTFMGWSPAVKSTVDPAMANENGEIVYTATWQKNAEDVSYKLVREYYIDGTMIAKKTNSNNTGNVGDVIVGSNVFSSTSIYKVDGKDVSFDFDHSNPASITLVADAASNVITAIYNHKHVDANNDGVCDECGTNNCPHTDVSYTDNGNGTHNGECDKCHETVVVNQGHTDSNGDYHCDKCGANMCPGHVDNDGDGKCDNCGDATDVHSHVWGAWVDDNNGTTHTRHCTGAHCDVSQTANHNWTLIDSKAATCTEDGYKTYKCNDCGAEKTETVEATGHSWGKWVDDENGTTHSRECANCDATQTANHNWDDGVVTTPATCGKDGVKTYTCEDCGATKTETIPATGEHVWDDGVVTTPATCDKDGVKTYTCTACGATKTEVIPATGHKDENNDGKCDICGKDLGTKPTDPTNPTDPADDPNHQHTDKDGDGICDDCGHEFHCDCICHRHGKIWKVFFKIYVVFWKLFGINPVCKCGRYHWVR